MVAARKQSDVGFWESNDRVRYGALMPLVTIDGVFYLEDLNRQKDILREMADNVGSRFIDRHYDSLVAKHGAFAVTLITYRILAAAKWAMLEKEAEEKQVALENKKCTD